MKSIKYIALVLLLVGLNACSGGDGDSAATDIPPVPSETNSAPVASNISTSSDLTSPYIQISLIATDADSDSLSYYLENPYLGTSGSGYEEAFIEPETNQLYILLKSDYANNQVVLNYKASDSLEFSNSATVTIAISATEDHGLGAEEEEITTYAQVPTHYFDDSLLGSYNNELPSSIDLSANMPTPGNQGQQNSCVGWAVGYALKSYQEKLEMGWELNSPNTIFSPAYIYNQINGGQDKGSIPSEALDLLINKGASTWANMPYSASDYLSKPSSSVHSHAASFKAKEYKKLTNTEQMKAALINKHPIMIGIQANNSFSNLSGSNSVYSTTGNYNGGHAVTVTGYDDSRYGGAFKIINSYGIDWGDNGYFWLPYSNINEVVLMAYVLIDKQNDDSSVVEVLEPTRDNLPNLEIQNWNYSFNPIPGGTGELKYSIINTGTGTASANFDVNLMLSSDTTFNSSDIYVAYEEVPFELEIGGTAYREEGNEMGFTLPQNLQAGTYYMALWVDDLDEVDESNEKDNLSHANDRVVIQSASLSDIIIDSWETTWDANGDGVLKYRVCNTGGSSTIRTDWDINLMLSTTPNPANDADSYFVFYEDIDFILDPRECVYRDQYSPAYYSLFKDAYTGASVSLGTYYISLWVDDQNLESESNENNNYSTSDSKVSVSNARSLSFNEKKSAFNGRNFSKISKIKKVVVTVDSKGKRSFRTVDNDDIKKNVYYEKIINSKNEVLFPAVKKHAMPKVD